MNYFFSRKSCRPVCLNGVRLFGLTVISTLIVACQPMPTKQSANSVDNNKVYDGVLGVRANIATKQNICKRPVKINRKRYGRLSYKGRRRQMYDYVTGIRQKVYAHWLKPEGVGKEESCSVLIKQRIDGCVRNVSFKNCRHYKMRTTVRSAVMKASPLPEAPHPALFSTEVLLNFKLK